MPSTDMPPDSPVPSDRWVPATKRELKELLLEVIHESKSKGLDVIDDEQTVAPKLQVKKVHEVWDAIAGRYEITTLVPSLTAMDELDHYAFVVRTRIDKKTEEPTIFVDLKSESLRDMLRTILGEVEWINLRNKKPTIEQSLLYRVLPNLDAYRNNNVQDSLRGHESLKHLDLLIQHIKDSYAHVNAMLQPLLAHGEITFDLLWALFCPDQMIYTRCKGTGKPKCFKYHFGEAVTEHGENKFRVEGHLIDFDGNKFGNTTTRTDIPKFHGTKKICSLNAFPLSHHPVADSMRTQLIDTGHKFIQLMGTHYRHYCGFAFMVRKGKHVKTHVNSRIMVDAALFHEKNPSYSFDQEGFLSLEDLFSKKKDSDHIVSSDQDPLNLGRDDLLRCSPTVPGFSFQDKMWLHFAVVDICDVVWQPSIFNALTLPKQMKDMVASLAEARTGHLKTPPFDDFVPGKGRGLNILMHGPPGMGKTMTAEAVSEHLQRPLYSISAGELGTDAAALEETLTQVFHLASRWNAILLLDEADTYMERRSTQDIFRNGLVSVFLRKLEYCESILFLTTNRVTAFDDAIISRMHIMLGFQSMALKARKEIWENFIGRAHTEHGPAQIGAKDLDRLSEIQLNARQIKNVVATAHAMASKARTRVVYADLDTVINHITGFLNDFNGVDRMSAVYN